VSISMTASKWNAGTAQVPPQTSRDDLFDNSKGNSFIEKFDEEEVTGGIDIGPLEENEGDSTPSNIPDELPILPLRGLVVYPQVAVPLTIGQPRSVRLVDDAMAGDKLIGLVTSKNPELENPGPDDL
jgi:ATP-dependent Lon protease